MGWASGIERIIFNLKEIDITKKIIALVALSEDLNNKILEVISQKKMEVKSLIDETHLGIFENKTGKTNVEEFESQVNNILNKASFEAGKIGRKNLDSNKFKLTSIEPNKECVEFIKKKTNRKIKAISANFLKISPIEI